MSEMQHDEAEKIFRDDFLFIERTKKVVSKQEIDLIELRIEYNVLAEKYAQLLKNAVRIARMGDKAQKKLIRIKEKLDSGSQSEE